MEKIKIGISKCLLGVRCRYDKGHKEDRFITHKMGKYFDFIPFCPEEEVLGTPRESIRLVSSDSGETIRVLGNKTKTDVTQKLLDVSKDSIPLFKKNDISGFIFKAKSPSCGLYRVKLYRDDGHSLDKKVNGVFAQTIIDSFDYLPIEDEARLNDSWLRENFIMELFCYSDLQNFLKSEPNMSDLVAFHTKYKFLLLSKNQDKYYKIGKLVGNQDKLEFSELLAKYREAFISLISEKSNVKQNINVLQHILGFLKDNLTKEEKREILESFEQFSEHLIPLIVPIKILNLLVIKYDIEYLKNQIYLNPYPDDLALRSDVKAFK